MNVLEVTIALHIGFGITSVACGGLALGLRKGSAAHRAAGRGFVAAMLAMGASGVAIGFMKPEPDRVLVLGMILTCYFVVTGWASARRGAAVAGRFEAVAFAFAVAIALAFAALAATAAFGSTGRFDRHGPVTILPNAVIAGIAAGLDLSFLIRGRLTGRQRLARHVWRIGYAMLVVSFALLVGEQGQKLMPGAIRGSPLLSAAPIAVVAIALFWLVRLRFPGRQGATEAGGVEAAARP